MGDFFKTYADKIFTIIILLIFSIFLAHSIAQQNSLLQNMQNELNKYSSTHSLVDKEGTIQNKVLEERNTTSQDENPFLNPKIVEQKVNIPLEILKEVKSFNEVLNQRQNDTLQMILYVVAFIGIIATFFGYKTIKDIKENADNETKKITAQYEQTFKLLNDISETYKKEIVAKISEMLALKQELTQLKIANEHSLQAFDSSIKKLDNSINEREGDFKNLLEDLKDIQQKINTQETTITQLKESVTLLEGKIS